eukprot:725415-Hanusia_phi.AAC.1
MLHPSRVHPHVRLHLPRREELDHLPYGPQEPQGGAEDENIDEHCPRPRPQPSVHHHPQRHLRLRPVQRQVHHVARARVARPRLAPRPRAVPDLPVGGERGVGVRSSQGERRPELAAAAVGPVAREAARRHGLHETVAGGRDDLQLPDLPACGEDKRRRSLTHLDVRDEDEVSSSEVPDSARVRRKDLCGDVEAGMKGGRALAHLLHDRLIEPSHRRGPCVAL